MPYDGSNVYSQPAATQAVSGATVSSTKFNSVVDDIEAALNDLRYQNLNVSAPVETLLGSADAAAIRTNLGLVIGTDVQAYNSDLADLVAKWVAASASGPASLDFAEDTDNGTNRVRLRALAALSADADVDLPGATGAILSTNEAKTLTKGFDVADYNAGTQSSGTFTPDPANGQIQRATNNGAHTLAAPSKICPLVIHYINGASAGAITTSGFTIVTGDAFTTTNAHEFICYITVSYNGSSYRSHLHVERLV